MRHSRAVNLRPCPFCGGKAVLEDSSRGFVNGKSTRVAYVRCISCEARSGKVDIHAYTESIRSSKATDIVIELWNSRVPEMRNSSGRNKT